MLTKHYLNIQYRIIYMLGINITDEKKRSLTAPYRFYFTMIGALFFIAPTAAYALEDVTDVDKFTKGMSITLVLLLSQLKICIFLIHRKSILQLISQIENILSKETDEQNVQIIVKECQRDQILTKIYCLLVCVTAISAYIMPFGLMAVNYMKTGHIFYVLPLPGSFPYDNQILRNFLLTVIWTSIAIFGIISNSIGMDTLFCGLTHSLCAYFQILGRKIIKMTNPDGYKQIIREHQYGLKLAFDLAAFFRNLIFAEFFITTLQICVSGYQISMKMGKTDMLFFCFYFLTVLIQVFVYAFCGQRVQTESAVIAYTLYDGCWYDAKNYGKLRVVLLMMLQRIQRPCKIDGYFFEANLTTFTSVLSTGVSYIALLRSFEE